MGLPIEEHMIQLEKIDKGRFKKSAALVHIINTFCAASTVKFVELGVYDGLNAEAIARLLTKKKLEYIGFDFFEDAKAVDLSKTNPGVHANLHSDAGFVNKMHVATIYKLLNPCCASVRLIKGDITKLLPKTPGVDKADMYYIDGAHTYVDVKHNYQCVKSISKRGTVVVFDDVAFPEIKQFMLELKEQGVKLIDSSGMSYTIIER
jgi:hypothetical protein